MENQLQIPRTIHYCWFSGETKSVIMRECIKSWERVMPEYQIKCWDASLLDFNVPFIKQAYECKNWAFVTDYMRFYILWKEGGIYLDSDVEVYKSFDPFLKQAFFSGIEYDEKPFQQIGLSLIDQEGHLATPVFQNKSFGLAIEAAIIGAVKGHPYIKACLDYYQNTDYMENNGTIFRKECPVVMAETAIPYGFIFKNIEQELKEGMCLYPYPTFVYGEGFEEKSAYARHWRNGSWRDKREMSRIYKWLDWLHVSCLYRQMERSPFLFHLYRRINHIMNK